MENQTGNIKLPTSQEIANTLYASLRTVSTTASEHENNKSILELLLGRAQQMEPLQAKIDELATELNNLKNKTDDTK